MNLKVSLIISFYNKIDNLRLVLASLEMQTFKDFEVIIADDGSSKEVVDELKAIPTSFPLKHIWHPDNGWQKPIICNIAVTKALADYLIFIDSDCFLHPKFIEDHMNNRGENIAVSGRRVMLTDNISKSITVERVKGNYMRTICIFRLIYAHFILGEKVYIRHAFRISNKWFRKLFIKDRCRGFWGCNFSTYKKNILAVNGYDERFLTYGGEDADLDMRLRAIGVMPKTVKHLATQYHIYHKQQQDDNDINNAILTEHINKKTAYTPYGIVKS